MNNEKKNKKLLYIVLGVSGGLLFILIFAMFIFNGFDLSSLMGNSVTNQFYYCEDSTYALKENKCLKTNTTSPSILGDVNGDGKVDEIDSETLKKYLGKTITLTEEQLVAADVNSDGIISVGDSENIRLYASGIVVENGVIDSIGTLSVCPKNYNLSNGICTEFIEIDAKLANYKKGDINSDGMIDSKDIKLLNKYLKKESTLTTVQLNIADYNSNGIIDLNDLNALEDDLNEKSNDSGAVGDINLDGVVNSNDVILLDKYVNKKITLKSEALNVSDIDLNGTINLQDVSLLAKKISDFYQSGDINMDGIVNAADLTIFQNAFNGVGKLNLVQQNLCDTNQDNVFDLNDINYLRSNVISQKKFKAGDTNMDGVVGADDVSIIENYILNRTILTIEQLSLADYNKDGVIDNMDANSLAGKIASNYELGDINMDGKRNMLDIRMLNSFVSKTTTFNTVEKLLADINGDKKVTAADLIKR